MSSWCCFRDSKNKASYSLTEYGTGTFNLGSTPASSQSFISRIASCVTSTLKGLAIVAPPAAAYGFDYFIKGALFEEGSILYYVMGTAVPLLSGAGTYAISCAQFRNKKDSIREELKTFGIPFYEYANLAALNINEKFFDLILLVLGGANCAAVLDTIFGSTPVNSLEINEEEIERLSERVKKFFIFENEWTQPATHTAQAMLHAVIFYLGSEFFDDEELNDFLSDFVFFFLGEAVTAPLTAFLLKIGKLEQEQGGRAFTPEKLQRLRRFKQLISLLTLPAIVALRSTERWVYFCSGAVLCLTDWSRWEVFKKQVESGKIEDLWKNIFPDSLWGRGKQIGKIASLFLVKIFLVIAESGKGTPSVDRIAVISSAIGAFCGVFIPAFCQKLYEKVPNSATVYTLFNSTSSLLFLAFFWASIFRFKIGNRYITSEEDARVACTYFSYDYSSSQSLFSALSNPPSGDRTELLASVASWMWSLGNGFSVAEESAFGEIPT